MVSNSILKLLRGLAAFTAAIVLFGCTPPQYDAQTDQLITALQTDTDTLIIHLVSLDDQINLLKGKQDKASASTLENNNAAATYSANLSSYNKITVDFVTLKTRINAEPSKSTPHLDNALEEINLNLFGSNSLQSQHKSEDILLKGYLQFEQGILDLQFSTLLSYELILKAGSSTAKTS